MNESQGAMAILQCTGEAALSRF